MVWLWIALIIVQGFFYFTHPARVVNQVKVIDKIECFLRGDE